MKFTKFLIIFLLINIALNSISTNCFHTKSKTIRSHSKRRRTHTKNGFSTIINQMKTLFTDKKNIVRFLYGMAHAINSDITEPINISAEKLRCVENFPLKSPPAGSEILDFAKYCYSYVGDSNNAIKCLGLDTGSMLNALVLSSVSVVGNILTGGLLGLFRGSFGMAELLIEVNKFASSKNVNNAFLIGEIFALSINTAKSFLGLKRRMIKKLR